MPAAFRYDKVYGERFAEVLKLQAQRNGAESTEEFIEAASKLYQDITNVKGKSRATAQFKRKGILGPKGRPFNEYHKDLHKAVKPSQKALETYSQTGNPTVIKAFIDSKKIIEQEQPSRERKKKEKEFDESVVRYALSLTDGKNVNALENGLSIMPLARFISKKLGIKVFNPKNISKLAQKIKTEQNTNAKKTKTKKATKKKKVEKTLAPKKTAKKPLKTELPEDIKKALYECKEVHPKAKVEITEDGKFKLSIPRAGSPNLTTSMTLGTESDVLHNLRQYTIGFN